MKKQFDTMDILLFAAVALYSFCSTFMILSQVFGTV